MVLQTLAVAAWFIGLIVVLVLLYFYYRDRKVRKTPVTDKVVPSAGKRGSDKSYTIVFKEDGSVQVLFDDGVPGKKPSSGRPVASAYRSTEKILANRRQLTRFLGGAITSDLPKILPKEKGTYALILHVWKNKVTPIDVPLDSAGKKCKSCGTRNDSDASYCKNCGKQLK
jgi:hypothetical protein